jgi:site-specific DNA-methyltransferase (adenine-specific)
MGKKWDYDVPSVEAWSEVLRVLKPGGHLISFGGPRTYHRLVVNIEDAGFEVRDQIMWIYGSGFPKSFNLGKEVEEWEGWGTALKPAHEPVALAHKPLQGTVASNVMEWGTGAVNVDECRIESGGDVCGTSESHSTPQEGWDRPWRHDEKSKRRIAEAKKEGNRKAKELGRFPANVIHDGSEEVVQEFPEAGSAARFFYCAKATPSERGESNDHPTVKPKALIRYLLKLITPPGGTVLDPFMGSGTLPVVCEEEDTRYIAVELSEHNLGIALDRIRKPRRKKLPLGDPCTH